MTLRLQLNLTALPEHSNVQDFNMYTAHFLFLFSTLFFSVSGEGASVRNFEISADFNASKYRVDAEQDPFTTVTLVSQSGDANSNLFGECIAASRTFEAKFASIELPEEITYTRYVPDLNMSYPVPWENPQGTVSDIFECASAAAYGEYDMFNYSVNGCKLSKLAYDLNRAPECEGEDVDALFVRPQPSGCLLPRFQPVVGLMVYSGTPYCVLINEGPMTYDDAKSFCEGWSLVLFNNAFNNGTVTSVISKIQELGYTKNNKWVSIDYNNGWSSSFLPADWVGGVIPPRANAGQPDAAYMDYQQGWKLTVASKSALAGVICETAQGASKK